MAHQGEGAPRRVGDWVLATHIGSGSFAVVWRARHATTGQEAAVKEINLDRLNAKLKQSLESEVSILKRITHENIVRLLEVLEVRRGRACGKGRRRAQNWRQGGGAARSRAPALTPHPLPAHRRSAAGCTW